MYDRRPPERDKFWRVYGDIDDRRRSIARPRAAYHSSMLAHYAHDVRDATPLADTLGALRRSVEE